jgi:hypothetical protein
MAGDLGTLAKRIKRLRKDLPDRVNQVAVKVALDIVSNLVDNPPSGTPVDTSTALSNWQVKLGSGARSLLRAHVLGEKGSSQGASAAKAREAAAEALRVRKVGQIIYISNNAPYIRRLAYEGHSKQSPSGWVEGGVLRARMVLRQQRGQLLK